MSHFRLSPGKHSLQREFDVGPDVRVASEIRSVSDFEGSDGLAGRVTGGTNLEASDDALTRPYRVFCAVMVGVFLLSAGVQWNDPDPLLWIAFYGFAALTAFAALAGARMLRTLEIGLAIVALGTVVALTPALREARLEAVTSIEMKSSEDEEVRELGGAAIVLVFAATMRLRRWRMARRVAAP
ncbi:MAG: transmembrane 220 family protein [Myxococcota bacterium]|nr:transmembrane 220 family protein [Myxococcota bacterium]